MRDHNAASQAIGFPATMLSARHYRDLAEEVRTKADSIKNREGAEVFEKLAADYDSLAESLEQAAKLLGSN